MQEVLRFFESRHPNCYKIFNLCTEKHYDASKFNGNVAHLAMVDGEPCSFGLLIRFCEEVHAWLQQHPQNVAAVHCRLGINRSGMCIASYLLYAKKFPSAHKALEEFAQKRTLDGRAVSLASQLRWVQYMEKYVALLDLGIALPDIGQPVYITGVVLARVGGLRPADVWMSVTNNGEEKSTKSVGGAVQVTKTDNGSLEFCINESAFLVSGDVKIEVYQARLLGKTLLFVYWFNTRFLWAIDYYSESNELKSEVTLHLTKNVDGKRGKKCGKLCALLV